MRSSVLPTADAVTAVEDTDRRVVLLVGLGDSAYDHCTTQTESLWNSHHSRANKVIVEDVAKEHRGIERNQSRGDCDSIEIQW